MERAMKNGQATRPINKVRLGSLNVSRVEAAEATKIIWPGRSDVLFLSFVVVNPHDVEFHSDIF